MKIGLISDIHANLKALETALKILEQERADTILCAGDLVGRGLEGDAVVRLVQERQIPCVMGNHDYDAIDNQHWLREKPDSKSSDTDSGLSEDTLAYLSQLPAMLRYEWEGLRILLVHGTPESNMDYLFPKSPAIKFKLIAREAKADVIIFGHTHEPTQARFMGVWFFNPGSIYGDKSRGSHTCATLTLPECIFDVFDLANGKQVSIPTIR